MVVQEKQGSRGLPGASLGPLCEQLYVQEQEQGCWGLRDQVRTEPWDLQRSGSLPGAVSNTP